jgi:hypothetical protein
MTAVPEWMRPPRPEGWCSEDLDKLAEAPRHTELIDGALVFMMRTTTPFAIKLDLDGLVPGRKS